MRFVSVLASEYASWLEAASSVEKAPIPPRTFGWATALGFISFGIFASQAPSAMPSGDAALYAQQAQALDFGERTVHLGYYLAAAFWSLFQSDAADLVFNLFSCALAGAVVGLIVTLAATLSQRLDLGLLAGFSLLGSFTVWRQAVWAEVYIGQAFFFVLAAWLLLRAGRGWGRQAGAGLSLAGSVLFSPSTLLGVPALVALKPRMRAFIALGTAGGGVVLAVLAFVWKDYFFGPRGLFGAEATAGGPAAAVVKEGFEVIYGFTALLPFLLLGSWALASCRRGRRALGVLGILWLPTFLFGERYPDVPVQLPTWILMAPVLVAGVAFLEARLDGAKLGRRALWLAPMTMVALLPFLVIPTVASRSRSFAVLESGFVAALLTVTLVAGVLSTWMAATRRVEAVRALFILWTLCGLALALRLVQDQNHHYEGYRQQVLDLKENAAVDYVAIGTWEQGILLEHYIYGRPYTGHTLDIDALRSGDAEASALLDAAFEQGRELWLLKEDAAVGERIEASGLRFVPEGAFRVARPADPDSNASEETLQP